MYGYGPPPPWGYPMPPPQNRELTLSDVRKNLDEWKAWEKDLEEKGKIHAQKKKSTPTFSLLETFSLVTVSGLILGPFIGYLYLSMLVTFIQKYAIIAPLLQK